MSTLKTHIKVLRAKLNMTQKELAEAVDVRRETIVHLEQGKYMPSLELAYRIARVFNAAIEEVFEFKD
ncbi:MAG: helix-turn-helix transcriptional regulator [Clostridiales bacterium]|nr:helix-turn-helix transcriptional regulator [Clostridiales bacterium]MCF8023741.1 helix-turn-helix transcriptional regulator [Clostridiales bacterium]